MRAGIRSRIARAVPQPPEHPERPGSYPLHPWRPASPRARGEGQEEPVQVRVGPGEVAFDSAEGARPSAAPVHRGVRVRAAEPGRVPRSPLTGWQVTTFSSECSTNMIGPRLTNLPRPAGVNGQSPARMPALTGPAVTYPIKRKHRINFLPSALLLRTDYQASEPDPTARLSRHKEMMLSVACGGSECPGHGLSVPMSAITVTAVGHGTRWQEDLPILRGFPPRHGRTKIKTRFCGSAT